MKFAVKDRYRNTYTVGEVLGPGESSFYGSGLVPAERRRAEREALEAAQEKEREQAVLEADLR